LNITKKRSILAQIILCLIAGYSAYAQESDSITLKKLTETVENLENRIRILQKLKVTGYVQAQFQHAQANADAINFKQHGKANAYETAHNKDYSRFAIRRGRLKFAYEEGIAAASAQIDITEKGIAPKDIYLQINDPIYGRNYLKIGLISRPFGHESSWSAMRREWPERTRTSQTIFPDEFDLGFMLRLQTPDTSPFAPLSLEAGCFAGNGIRPQTVSQMDFIARLAATQLVGNYVSISGGISAYIGGVFQNDSSIYQMANGKFILHDKSPDRIGKYAPRQYFGADIQYLHITPAGLTQIKLEYVRGKHPGNAAGAYDFRFNTLPAQGEIYMRRIAGGYVSIAQDLGPVPITATIKYDFFDPNTEISGNSIGADASRTGAADISMRNIGCGLTWRINSYLRFTAFYDFTKNETSAQLPARPSDNEGEYIA
jgi:hypothetical protein